MGFEHRQVPIVGSACPGKKLTLLVNLHYTRVAISLTGRLSPANRLQTAVHFQRCGHAIDDENTFLPTNEFDVRSPKVSYEDSSSAKTQWRRGWMTLKCCRLPTVQQQLFPSGSRYS